NINSVLPAFVGQLTGSAPIIGLVSTVFNGGWLLPQLATAHLINDKPRKKPYLLAGLSGRILFWVIALALWTGLARNASATLILFFACLGLFAVSDGFASVSWFDILARAIPLKQRGRLISTGQFIGGIIGVGVGILVGLILERYLFPTNYALLFTLAGVALIPSVIALSLLREPQCEEADPETNGQARRIWLEILSTDSNFRHLIACRLLVGMIELATSFYVVHAAQVLRLPQGIVGSFVTAQTLAGVAGSVVLGLVSERWGPRYVARVGAGTAIIGPLFALIVHLWATPWLTQAYPLIFAALGIVRNAYLTGFTNYLLEIAPDHVRPTYVGLGNTIMGILTLVPMAGGWLLEATSYTTLFSVTAALVSAGFLLTLRLKPAQQAPPCRSHQSQMTKSNRESATEG
ncbi:MAG: hypothetical protein DRI48_03025, partial [Chloroflexi bacterium]